MNPITLPLSIGGLVWLLRGRGGVELRSLGITFLVLFAWFSLGPSKSYYLAPAYPFLFAAGAVWLAPHLSHPGRYLAAPSYLVALAVSGLLLAPIGMPILPPATYAAWYGFLGTDAGAQMEHHQGAALPQWLADRFGWTALAARVSTALDGLPGSERRAACIFTANYGEAAALDYFGKQEHLPAAVSGNNSYYFWGPGHCSGRVVITLGLPPAQVSSSFRSVSKVGHTSCEFCMPAEDGQLILLARDPRRSLKTTWLRVENLG